MSAKKTFQPNAFRANGFASGTFRGVGSAPPPPPPVSGGPIDDTWTLPAGNRLWALPAGLRLWVVPAVRWLWSFTMPNDLDAADVIPFRAGMVKNYAFDFGSAPEITAGLTMSSATIVPGGSGIVVGGVAVAANGYQVRGTFSGSPAPGNYSITVTVNWSDGTKDIRYGTLVVEA